MTNDQVASITNGSIRAARDGKKVIIIMQTADEYEAMMVYDTIAKVISDGCSFRVDLKAKK